MFIKYKIISKKSRSFYFSDLLVYLSIKKEPCKQLVALQPLWMLHLYGRQLPTHTDCRGDTEKVEYEQKIPPPGSNAPQQETYKMCSSSDTGRCQRRSRTRAEATLKEPQSGSTEAEAVEPTLLQQLKHLKGRNHKCDPPDLTSVCKSALNIWEIFIKNV